MLPFAGLASQVSGGLTSEMAQALGSALRPELSSGNRVLRLRRRGEKRTGPQTSESWWIERMWGEEGINCLFHFELDCLGLAQEAGVQQSIGEEWGIGLLQADGHYRYWFGYVSSIAYLGMNDTAGFTLANGMRRYRVRLDAWPTVLCERYDTRIFQDLDAIQIVRQVLSILPQARIEPAKGLRTLSKRTLCTQYNESDWDFCVRLLAEEGLSFYFNHDLEDAAAPAGFAAQHALVIIDAQTPSPVCAQNTIRFHAPDTRQASTLAQGADSLQSMNEHRQIVTRVHTLAQWDSRNLRAYVGSSSSAGPKATPQAQNFAMFSHGFNDEESAKLASEAHSRYAAQCSERFSATGSVRVLKPFEAFTLAEHKRYSQGGGGAKNSQGRYRVAHIRHEACNNLNAQVAKILNAPDLEHGTYRQYLHLLAANTEIAPAPQPKPHIPGELSAYVMTRDEQTNSTERDHRIKVQFDWQRGTHPNTGGMQIESSADKNTASNATPNDPAPGNLRSGVWVRVTEAIAGANWGSHFTPRAKDEVRVQFLDGDPDQPVVVGSIHNGQDRIPFQPANHQGTLSGYRSENFAQGYAQWLIDDTPNQGRSQLAIHYAATQLNLGYLIQQAIGSSQRQIYKGLGAELTTQAWGVARAAQSLFISATARPSPNETRHSPASTQMDIEEARAQLRAMQQTSEQLNQAASSQKALSSAVSEAIPNNLTQHLKDTEPHQPENVQPDAAPPQPHLFAETPSSMAFTSPGSIHHHSDNLAILSQSNTHLTAAQTLAASAGAQASFFTHEGGIHTTAAQGSISLQAHAGTLQLYSAQKLNVTSNSDNVEVLAQKEITLSNGQTRIRFTQNSITFEAAMLSAKGSGHQFMPLQGMPATVSLMPSGALTPEQTKDAYDQFFVLRDGPSGLVRRNQSFSIQLKQRGTVTGKTDHQGRCNILDTATQEELLSLKLLDD